MKVICGQKRFGYSEGDSTGKLLRIIMAQTQMKGFWETPLMVVGTLRNNDRQHQQWLPPTLSVEAPTI
ncbi:hypothetical protein ACF8FB_10570 [Pseudomonas sp. yb_2]|uniref:hypothetical protein n=1 Tax=Pseudomonas sp. yb_2 TaxID=3367218 RepID=UPI00370C8B97